MFQRQGEICRLHYYTFFFASLVFRRVNALKAYLGPGEVQHVRGVGELSGFCAERDCWL